MRVNHSAKMHNRVNRDIFSILFNIKICCVFSLESPHRGGSNEYTQYTIFNIQKKITLNYSRYVALGIVSKGLKTSSKLAISVRATEVLLYIDFKFRTFFSGLIHPCLL